MRLKHIEHCSFQRSEFTNFEAVSKKYKLKLNDGEVACLVSLTGNQICFVYGFFAPDEKNPAMALRLKRLRPMVLRSERLRLTRGTWDPLMLANYAKEVGIELDGIKRFEDFYREGLEKRGHGRRWP